MTDFDLAARTRQQKASIEFFARNPGGTEFRFKPVSWEGAWPKIGADLEPREMEIECLRKVPVEQSAIVRAVYAGKTIFRGFVEYRPEINGGKKTIICSGMEKILDSVICPNFFYVSNDLNLNTIFANDLSPSVVPGIFAIANSSLPPGWPASLESEPLQIVKLPGMGRSSRWSDNDVFVCGLYGAIRLIEEPTLSNLDVLDNTLFRDDTDLYIRVDNVTNGMGWYSMGGLLIDNGFDTTCRVGVIDGGSAALRGDLEINIDTKLGRLITNFAKGHDKFVHIRDTASYTYFDILDEEGRGEGEGLFEISEKDCTKFRRLAAKDPRCNSLTGMGEGYQYFTARDLTYAGPWVGRTYEVKHGFKDSAGFMLSYTTDQFDLAQLDYQWEIGTYKQFDIRPGDYLRLRPRGELSEVLSCEKITRTSSGESILVLGAPRPRFGDSWEALKDITQGFTDKTIWKTNTSNTQTTTFYPHDPAHTGTEATLTFVTPDNVKSEELKPRITLDSSISYSSLSAIPISQRCMILITVNGTDMLPISNVTVGSTIGAVDVTDWITQNASNTIKYRVFFAKECSGSHSDYSGHPQLSVSSTMNFYRRMSLT